MRAVDKQVSGKFYWEITYNVAGNASDAVGVASALANLALGVGASASVGTSGLNRNGDIWVDGVSVTGGTTFAWSSGQVICIAVDCDARRIWYRLGAAGAWNQSLAGDPATGRRAWRIAMSGRASRSTPPQTPS